MLPCNLENEITHPPRSLEGSISINQKRTTRELVRDARKQKAENKIKKMKKTEKEENQREIFIFSHTLAFY